MNNPKLENETAANNSSAANCYAEKPDDWEKIYNVKVDGKTLEAMKFLADYVLNSKLPSWSAIGAADCLQCFQYRIRKESA